MVRYRHVVTKSWRAALLAGGAEGCEEPLGGEVERGGVSELGGRGAKVADGYPAELGSGCVARRARNFIYIALRLLQELGHE